MRIIITILWKKVYIKGMRIIITVLWTVYEIYNYLSWSKFIEGFVYEINYLFNGFVYEIIYYEERLFRVFFYEIFIYFSNAFWKRITNT